MAGRKPSADPSVAMSIYPPRSLSERLKARAQVAGELVGKLAVDYIRKGVEADERREAKGK